MSDKSFGDHTSRNIVKNPLLSSAVTGLSLEDLTHKAVLLPVTPSLGLISRSDQQGAQKDTLAHADHETQVLPSGDALSPITLSNITQTTNPNILDSQYHINKEKNRDKPSVTQSKASVKSDDDFDVNEYIARLQGSRYVSAPLHSHHKDDQNTNLVATEENLEEINLNESQGPAEVQQSLTADIAQNFSQLPTVLPHVASAVFSSFSNMLNYKAKEQPSDRPNIIPEHDQKSKGYDEVQFQRPDVGIALMGMEEFSAPKEVAPPPKEPPIGGTSNFRITTKKKYAQIPGLSSGDPAQNMTFNSPSQNIPFGQNMPPIGYNLPPTSQNIPFGQNLPPYGQNMAPPAQNVPAIGQNMPQMDQSQQPQITTPFIQSPPTIPLAQNAPPKTQNIPPSTHYPPPISQNMPVVSQNVPSFFNPREEPTKVIESNENTHNLATSHLQYNILNPFTAESQSLTTESPGSENQPNSFAITKDNQNYFTPIEQKEQATRNIPSNTNVPGGAPIIPPPPMFSNIPRRDSQSGAGKSILPPSVARRISGNQPVIKPAVSTPSLAENIFVPSISEAASNSSGQVENNFTSGALTSAFVPAHNTSVKTAPIGHPPSSIQPPSQIESHPNIPASLPTSMYPLEKHNLAQFDSSASTTPTVLNIGSTNPPPALSIFTPGSNMDEQHHSTVPPSIFQPHNVQTPPSIFNPLQHTESASQNAPHPITQMPPLANSEPPKPVVDPPKATGNVNFRMTKKRPQYYAGPIEGVGAISNNVKPIIAPVIQSATPADVSKFQGAVFTPGQSIYPATDQYAAPNIEQASVPFDISRPVENLTSNVRYDINKAAEQTFGSPFDISSPQTQNFAQDYNTAFDMSRSTTEAYDPPKQESKGFGIIGSLKSKLSSIDINKIQNTVTTFFDPAYNETKDGELVTQDNSSYAYQQYGHQQQQFSQPHEQSSFDIFVPTVEHNQYSEFKHVGYDYSPNYQNYQTQEPCDKNQDLNVYSTSSYFTNPNYSTDQVHTTNPLYDHAQAHMPAPNYTHENIPEKIDTINTQQSKSIDNAPLYDPHNANNPSNKINQQKPVHTEQSQSYFKPNTTLSHSQQSSELGNIKTSEAASENVSYYNPNSNVQENQQIPVQKYFGINASVSQPMSELYTSVSTTEKQQLTFYDPNAFESHKNPVAKTCDAFGSDIQQKTSQLRQDLFSNVSTTSNSGQGEPQPNCDSALNTSKYNMGNIQTPSQQNMHPKAALVSASSFFDNPQTGHMTIYTRDSEMDSKLWGHALIKDDIKSEDVQQERVDSKDVESKHLLTETPAPIGAKTTIFDEQIKGRDINQKKLLNDNNLMESLSKGDLPIVGASSVPLFGCDLTREMSVSEYEKKQEASENTAKQSQNLYDANTGVSFFDSIRHERLSEGKPIQGDIVKEIPLDITGLSINDVKNVLLIEPPQESIGTVLKINSSINNLDISKPDEVSPEHYKRQNDQLPSTSFQENLGLKFDESRSNVFFTHSDSPESVLKAQSLQKYASAENDDRDASDLNICETCREVKTPDIRHDSKHKEPEDLAMQMVENITSCMRLSNPLTVPLAESDAPIEDRSQFDDQQFEEIAHIAEDTIETLQMQSAIDFLDNRIATTEVNDYGWTTENAAYSGTVQIDHDYGFKDDSDAFAPSGQEYGLKVNPTVPTVNDEYEFKLDPNAIGFFGNNSLFLENLPKNASDEIKAEIKHSHEEDLLPRQMSIPSAPPPEDDTKSDETGGLDVHSIEQDAKKDFPLEEEFIIEPSETDDDKIEFREQKRSSEDSISTDTFTNRVERFKKAVDYDDAIEQKGAQVYGSPPKPMASYFDTGNYAVESHYRNSLTSPTSINSMQFSTNLIRIPPGFEEEYARRLSGMSLSSRDNHNEPYIPETSTQTRPTSAITFSSPQNTKENVIGFEMRRNENNETYSKIMAENKTDDESPLESERVPPTSKPNIANPIQTLPVFTDLTQQPDNIPQSVQSLPDPKNFFSANVEGTKPTEPVDENVNRLASYFTMPAEKPEHSKSFFELSQSQNHYRHGSKENDNKNVHKSFFELSQSQNHNMDDVTKRNITNLMKDLTSPRNLQEQIVRTVNYFTVELDNEVKHNTSAAPINVKTIEGKTIPIDLKIYSKTKVNKCILVENDCKDFLNCKFCINNIPGINTKDFKVRTATNDTSATKTETTMTSEKDNNSGKRAMVNFGNFDAEGQAHDGITVMTENRTTSEYSPVKHHWFYRVDVEDKSVWRGFSQTDSKALEEAFQSPDLNEGTLVATDGGRYDVNVLGRLRLAVYWKEKPTNVRRCSWFYKGTTDARYVPYTEAVAEKLEEEYRHGVTTGEWHRRLSLPNSEMVIMHGPTVMVHFLHSGATDAFSTPPQTTSRPRVVRRGHEESEIEDCEPSRIDHLLLLCHGVGSACDMKFRSVEEVVEDFRSTSLQLLQSHYRNSFDNGIVNRVEVLPISWHAQLHSGETGVDRRLSRVTLDSIPRLRAFTNHTVLDVLFYTSPVFHQTIIDTVCSELNRIYSMFKKRNPTFKGDVSLGGHSLGSVILYDLLCHQQPEGHTQHGSATQKTYVAGAAGGGGQLAGKYPQLVFAPAALYALGSPIAIFECIRGVESLGMDFALPTCKNFFNIFHPYDPIAYRIEPLINPQLQEVKPSQIPHHKGRKRMHLELKDTMYRVGTDLKQKLIESLRTTWNKWKATPPTDGQLEKVVEEEMEKEQLCDESKDEQPTEVAPSPEKLGALNGGRRVDYVLQEAPLEMINEYLFAMTSHVGYWESEDTMLLMLREIYSSLGVQPDCTVPQQSMTVQRTRTLTPDEATVINEKEYPSTSRGGTC